MSNLSLSNVSSRIFSSQGLWFFFLSINGGSLKIGIHLIQLTKISKLHWAQILKSELKQDYWLEEDWRLCMEKKFIILPVDA